MEAAPAGKEFIEWQVTQAKPKEIHDFRSAVRGPKGYKGEFGRVRVVLWNALALGALLWPL